MQEVVENKSENVNQRLEKHLKNVCTHGRLKTKVGNDVFAFVVLNNDNDNDKILSGNMAPKVGLESRRGAIKLRQCTLPLYPFYPFHPFLELCSFVQSTTAAN